MRSSGPLRRALPEPDVASRTWDMPRPLAPFIGRQRESAMMLDLLGNPAVHLLTMTGPGGVGKTRLALDVADTASRRFDHRGAVVPLASIGTATLVLATLAAVLAINVAGRKADGGIMAFDLTPVVSLWTIHSLREQSRGSA